MKKPVILHCINTLGLGGAEILLRNTVKELDCYDHVICHLGLPDTLATDFSPHPVYNLRHTSFIKSIRSIKAIRKIIKKYNVEIIHSHLLNATILSRLARPKNITFFFTVHNILSKDAFEVNRLSLWIERLTYKKSQSIIGVSSEALNDYDTWVGIKGRSFVLYNYINELFFNLNHDNSLNSFGELKLVAIGNLRRQKNYGKLLDAFILLKDLPISLDIYGSGYLEKELLDKIKKERLNVRLMGRISNVSEVLPYYQAYIMPSLFEGFGIAPMEAMAAGLPVILSDLPVFREVAEDVPVYFNPNSSFSIAEAIRYAYANWQKIVQTTARGKLLIQNKASKEIYFKKLIDIYNS